MATKMTITPKKLSAAAVGIPLAVILAWVLETAVGVTMPGEVAGAVGGLCTFVASVLIPDEMEE